MGAWVWTGSSGYVYSNSPVVTPDGQTWKQLRRGYAWNGTEYKRFYPDGFGTDTTVLALTGPSTCGGSLSMTVRCTIVDGGGPVPGGTVTLWYRSSILSPWTEGPTETVDGAGEATLLVDPWPVCRAGLYKASYSGFAQWAPSDALGTTPDNSMPAPVLTGGTITNTSAQFSWTALACADTYEVRQDGVLVDIVTGTQHTATGLTSGSQVTFQVRGRIGSGCVGELSAPLVGQVGQSELRDTGAASGMLFQPDRTNTWRDDFGWGFHGDRVVQSYRSAASEQATGIIDYADLRTLLIAYLTDLSNPDPVLGDARITGGQSTRAIVTLKRNFGGGTGPVLGFQVSPDPSGNPGGVTRTGTVVNHSASDVGVTADYEIGVGLMERLARGLARSVTLYNTGTANYCVMSGENDTTIPRSCWLTVDWVWNYVTRSYIAPAWL